MRRNYSYLFGAFAGWLLCGCVLKAEAQAASEYCYQSCFGSLDEAEAQMRAALPYGAYLVRDKINITGGASDTPSYRIGDKVERQPPSDMSLPGYTIGGAGSADGICTANSEPFLQSDCVDEAQMIQGILGFYHQNWPDCTISSGWIDGARAAGKQSALLPEMEAIEGIIGAVFGGLIVLNSTETSSLVERWESLNF